MNRETIELLIKTGLLPTLAKPIQIASGILRDAEGQKSEYFIECGLCYNSIIECDEWQLFTSKIVTDFIDKNPSLPNLDKVIKESIMLEDYHWNWFKKALELKSEEYLWFFLKADTLIQAACIVYHPKKSVADYRDIFYVDYLSAAPWNRPSKLYERKYCGVGKEILKEIQKYIIMTYKYEYGFCLHSLPQATTFYEHIGMDTYPTYNKGQLSYFEMKCGVAKCFAGGTYAT